VKAVTPDEAVQLMEQGYVYVDVRTQQEFDAGHPPGAFNVPISFAGSVPNADFVQVLERAFGRDARLILGCKAGPRSRRAGAMLEGAGFVDLCEMSAGWSGARDPFGRPIPGWVAAGLPVEAGTPAGQAYDDVKNKG
jgi:rhodanese-related sulfurtransferase